MHGRVSHNSLYGVFLGPLIRDRQCIFSVFGGEVNVTGEILHGKTSPLRHDSKGLYTDLPQDLPVTRYHSLAGTHSSLPNCLQVTSWIAKGPDGGKGIIMGVRHKELLVEGVQFHPESILTAEGRSMIKNFLRMQGGTWAENERYQNKSMGHHYVNGISNAADVPKQKEITSSKPSAQHESILDEIYRHRKHAVEAQKMIPSLRPTDLEASYKSNLSPAQISFPERLKKSPFRLSLMAEIKRASPSKGTISLDTYAPEQARKYALAGASVISVLTEPTWFKGSIEDLRSVRRSLEGMPNRPAVLRKEFIFDEYQILEARLAGADTVLLIVKMLELETLGRLFHYSNSLGMEPMVEVNTLGEMDIAMKLGARVVGVNNRNLTNFEVDLTTTNRLMEKTSNETIVCALSGISGPQDVEAYKNSGVGAVLVGEALMRAVDVEVFIDELLSNSEVNKPDKEKSNILVKICGTRTVEAAKTAIEAGADLIGIILVEGRKRYVSTQTALEISKVVHELQKPVGHIKLEPSTKQSFKAIDYFEYTPSVIYRPDRAMLVGVFQDQPLSHIIAQQQLLRLDVVQLHGLEPVEWASLIPVPVIRRFGPSDPGLGLRGHHALPLLDSASGGSGQTLDMVSICRTLDSDSGLRVILAGGLTSKNIKAILKQLDRFRPRIVAVDVSSGVEEDGIQSLEKIKDFVQAAQDAFRAP